MDMSKPTEPVWTPPDRTPSQLRNARLKLIGSLLILAALAVAVLFVLVD
jgi:hypothetical protein